MVVLGDYWFALLLLIGVPLASVLYLGLRLILLRLFGVPEDKLTDWALKEASSHRVVELVRALRGKEPDPRRDLSPHAASRTRVVML